MPTLEWSDELVLDNEVMDDTHREFVYLLAKVEAAGALDDTRPLLQAWDALVEHTQDHFDREDAWMQQTGFAASNCHAGQHHVILEILREMQRRAHTDTDLALLRQLVGELGKWFVQHAQTMDTALAGHLQSVGFDPHTGKVARPQALPEQALQGCGGAACSTAG